MNQIQNLNPTKMRTDFTRADSYIYPDAPKLSFFQKMGRGLGKFMTFAGPIGAAVTAIALPGIGLPIAAGIYGMSRLSSDQLYRAQVRDQVALANLPQVTNVQLPGLYDQAPLDAGAQVTDFIAPSSLEPSISDVVIERNAAQQEAITRY